MLAYIISTSPFPWKAPTFHFFKPPKPNPQFLIAIDDISGMTTNPTDGYAADFFDQILLMPPFAGTDSGSSSETSSLNPSVSQLYQPPLFPLGLSLDSARAAVGDTGAFPTKPVSPKFYLSFLFSLWLVELGKFVSFVCVGYDIWASLAFMNMLASKGNWATFWNVAAVWLGDISWWSKLCLWYVILDYICFLFQQDTVAVNSMGNLYQGLNQIQSHAVRHPVPQVQQIMSPRNYVLVTCLT